MISTLWWVSTRIHQYCYHGDWFLVMVLSVSASFGTSTVQPTPDEPGAAQLGCDLAWKKFGNKIFQFILTPSTQYSAL